MYTSTVSVSEITFHSLPANVILTNPTALRMAKAQWTFGHCEQNSQQY